jgi:hypothetical protein
MRNRLVVWTIDQGRPRFRCRVVATRLPGQVVKNVAPTLGAV